MLWWHKRKRISILDLRMGLQFIPSYDSMRLAKVAGRSCKVSPNIYLQSLIVFRNPLSSTDPGKQRYLNDPAMSYQRHCNPWEVNYTLNAPVAALKPAAVRANRQFQQPAAVTFPLFPLLPPELRIRIWSLAAPHQRVIEIRSWGAGRYAPIKYSVHPHYLPAIFHVCKESRMEARRIYKRVAVGISAAVRVEGRKYVNWEQHPANPNSRRRLATGMTSMPHATPHPPAYVYVSWEHDTIYLGPEFQPRHLLKFLAAQGEGKELEGLRYLALDRKLWVGVDDGWGDVLRNCLGSLRTRENLTEVIAVPDDEERCLIDRWYLGKHDITLRQPDLGTSEEWEQAFVGSLESWFGKVWKGEIGNGDNTENDDENDEDETNEDKKMAMERGQPKPPKVRVMSLMRNGQKMREYADGISDIQKAMEDMLIWKTWSPPVSS